MMKSGEGRRTKWIVVRRKGEKERGLMGVVGSISVVVLFAVVLVAEVEGDGGRQSFGYDEWRSRTSPNYARVQRATHTFSNGTLLRNAGYRPLEPLPTPDGENPTVIALYGIDPGVDGFSKPINIGRSNAERLTRVSSTYVHGVNGGNVEGIVRELIEDGFNLFLVANPTWGNTIASLTEEFPSILFAFFEAADSSVFPEPRPRSVKWSISSDLVKTFWLQGYLAASLFPKVGFVANSDVPYAIVNYFLFGAREANPDVEIVYQTYDFELANVGESVQTDAIDFQAVVVAQNLVAAGAEIIVGVGETTTFHRSVPIVAGVPTIGYLVDHSLYAGPTCLFSVVQTYELAHTAYFTLYETNAWFNTGYDQLTIEETYDALSPFIPRDVALKFAQVVESTNPFYITLCSPGLEALWPPSNFTNGCAPFDTFVTDFPKMILDPTIEYLGVLPPPFEEDYGMSSGARIALYVLGALCVMITVLIALMIVLLRDKAVIHYSSPIFGLVMTFGVLLVNAGAMIYIPPTSDVRCTTTVWLANMGFALLVWAMFAKTARLYFLQRGAKKLHVVSISNTHLGAAIAVGLVVEIVLLCLFSFIEPLEDKSTFTDLFEYHTECEANVVNYVFLMILISYKMVLVFVTWAFSFSARKLGAVFDEVSMMSVAAYNMLMFAIIFIPVWVLVDDFEPQIIVVVIALLVCSNVTLWVLYFPKFLVIFRGKDGAQAKSEYDPTNTMSRD
mmetsp:Transcript_10492/g.29417  ORF Transcript_10492/g.29417 Transcript_10492/m.29417 type:complete len:731 (+) Transcript_10492:11-2203(+)